MERKIQQSSTIVNFCWRAKRRRWPESQRLQVLQGESEELFNELLEHYMQTHQPQSATESSLVETMAVARWRLWRVWGAQKLALDRDIAVQDPDTGPTSVRAMFAMRGSVDNLKVDVLLRYEIAFDDSSRVLYAFWSLSPSTEGRPLDPRKLLKPGPRKKQTPVPQHTQLAAKDRVAARSVADSVAGPPCEVEAGPGDHVSVKRRADSESRCYPRSTTLNRKREIHFVFRI
jgi:hypothetical protein